MDTEPPLASAAANPQSAPSHNSTSNTGGNNTVIVNPSSRNMSSIDSDAEYARQLQEEVSNRESTHVHRMSQTHAYVLIHSCAVLIATAGVSTSSTDAQQWP